MPSQCAYCGHSYPTGAPQCLTCGRPEPNPPGFYSNVKAAQEKTENDALKRSYQQAYDHATSQGTTKQLSEFENVVKNDAQLITACDISRLNDLIQYDDALYPVFMNLVRSGIRYPGDDRNNNDRLIAEEATFPGYSSYIGYAALAINDEGLPNYGNYFLVWDIGKIAHRTSLLIGNCLTLRRKLKLCLDDQNLPLGSRAVWDERHILAVAKCEASIIATTTSAEFAEILLKAGVTSDDDEFIEAHIWGPMTRRTIGKVIFAYPEKSIDPTDLEEIVYVASMRSRVRKWLVKLAIPCEVWT